MARKERVGNHFKKGCAINDQISEQEKEEKFKDLFERARKGVFKYLDEKGGTLAMAVIRKNLEYSIIPKTLRGLGITIILIGLMAMGFMCFAGIQL